MESRSKQNYNLFQESIEILWIFLQHEKWVERRRWADFWPPRSPLLLVYGFVCHSLIILLLELQQNSLRCVQRVSRTNRKRILLSLRIESYSWQSRKDLKFVCFLRARILCLRRQKINAIRNEHLGRASPLALLLDTYKLHLKSKSLTLSAKGLS